MTRRLALVTAAAALALAACGSGGPATSASADPPGLGGSASARAVPPGGPGRSGGAAPPAAAPPGTPGPGQATTPAPFDIPGMPDAPGAGHGPEPTADPPPRGNPGIPGVKAGKPEPIALAVTQTALGPTLTLTGSTVYRFNGDANRPTNSVCIGQCATAWPPLLTDGTPVHAGPGIDPTALGLYQRDDGTRQVTLGGWPLYLFSEDRAPGDTSGNNLGPTPDQQWKAVGPTGEPVRG